MDVSKRKELINQYVERAKVYLGTSEGSANHYYLVNLYNTIKPLPRGYHVKKVDPWCAVFISAVSAECNMLDIVLPECSCAEMINLYKKRGGVILPRRARRGDLVFYNWDGGNVDHVGYVCSVRKGVLKVIEGNKSDSVGYRYIEATDEEIECACRPDYSLRD